MYKKQKSVIRSSMIADEQSDAVQNIKKVNNRSQSFHQLPQMNSLIKQSLNIRNTSIFKPYKKQATQYDSAVKIKISQLSENHANNSVDSNSLSGDGSFWIGKDSPCSKRRLFKMGSIDVNRDEVNLAKKKTLVKFLSSGGSSPAILNKDEIQPIKRSATIKNHKELEVIEENEIQQIFRPSQDSKKESSDYMSEAKKIQPMHFESPKNGRVIENLKSEGPNTGSYVDSTINPLESPDIIQKELRNSKIPSYKYKDSFSTELKLRTNRISEVPNENSDQDIDSPNKEKELKVLDTTLNFCPPQLINKGARKTFSNHKDLISSSLDRYNHLIAFNGFDKQNEEVQALKKQLREDKAKFVKQKAILEQQVELLTMQLHEASEREKSIKLTYTAMMTALQIKQQSSDTSDYSKTNKYSPNSPFNGFLSPFRGSTSPVKQKSFIIRPQKSSESPLSRSNEMYEDLNKQIKLLENNVATSKLQIKTQDQLLMQKEDKMIELSSKINKMQQQLNTQNEIRQQEIKQIEKTQNLEMKKKIEQKNTEIERQMRSKLDEFYDKETYLNEKIINLQKDIQNNNHELDSQMKMVHMKGLRCLELEKQVYLHENQLQVLTKENERLIHEGNSRIQQLLTEMEKMNTSIVKLKKQASEMREQYTKEPQASQSAQEDDGTNKFITSPNDSMRNDDEQHQDPDYSFGDLQRLSLLPPLQHEETPSEQLLIDPKDSLRQSQALPISKKFSSSSKAHPVKSRSGVSKSPLGKSKKSSGGVPKKKVPTDLSQPQSKPAQVKYWQKDEKFIDDGSCSEECTNALRRQVADFRSQLSKLIVAYNDLKSSSQKEIAKLKGLVDFEKKRRVVAQEDKLEKSYVLMQELVERDKKIVEMQSKIHDLNGEKLEMESINQTYFGGAGGNGGAPDKSMSVYQSQQLYGTKGGALKGGLRGSFSKRRSSINSSNSQRSLGGSMNKMSYPNKIKSERKDSTTKFIDNQYGFSQFKNEKQIDGEDSNNYEGPRDQQIQSDIPQISAPIGNNSLKLPGIQSPTNNNHRLLTMKSLDSGAVAFKKFLSPTHFSKINQNIRKSEVTEVLKSKNVLIENTVIQPGCNTSRIIMGCNNGVGIEQELLRNSQPNREHQRTPDKEMYFDDSQYQQPIEACSEINLLSQSNGNEQWWNLESKQQLKEKDVEICIDICDTSRLFSPLSQLHSNREFTPLDQLPQDDLKVDVKRMQHGFAQSQQSLMTQALQMKKAQGIEDSEDDCNVDADVGEEYDATAQAKQKKIESHQEQLGKSLQEEKKSQLTQRQNVTANIVPPLSMTKLHESIENNQMAQSMRLRGLAVITPQPAGSFSTQRAQFMKSNLGSFKNPQIHSSMLNPQDMAASQAQSFDTKSMKDLKSPTRENANRITPVPSYYNQYSTQVPKKQINKQSTSMSLKNIFNPDMPKKLTTGPTQSIYNTIKQSEEKKTGRSQSRGSLDPNTRGSVNMQNVFKPQTSSTMAHKKFNQNLQ